MFEKEAEEYGLQQALWCTSESGDLRDAFKEGAEFGYNKAKEDADKMKSQFLELCNLKDMRIAELEKANEWHYVKNGDLPEVEKNVLVMITPDLFDVMCRGYDNTYYGLIGHADRIRAWKEIIPPKETD